MQTKTIYVSTNGSDEWSGRKPEADHSQTDGPLRTLEGAQKAVRKLKARLAEPTAIRVELRGGKYELDEPWRFHAEDSGFGRTTPRLARTWPVTWAAYSDETPVISGGRRIPGPWKKESLNGRAVYTTFLSDELVSGDGFTQLWVNGERRFRPKLPKKGLWQVEKGFHNKEDFRGPGHNKISDACMYKKGQIQGDWSNLKDIQLHFFGWWIDRHVKIERIDEANRTVHFDRTARMRMEWEPGDGVDFIVENVFEALTEPGEWYFDRSKGKLYYLPLPGEDMETAEVIAGILPRLMEIDCGDFLRFEGLTFAHCEWKLPDDQAGDKQAAAHVPAAIRLRNAEGCVFKNCCIEHVNTYGIEMLDGTVGSYIDRCKLTDLGAGAIRIWHDCVAPDAFNWQASVQEDADGWECTLHIPMTAVAAAIAADHEPEWRFLAGFTVPAETGDFSSWQAQGHDSKSIVADPLFINPANGNFRLRDDSPALALGFVRWSVEEAGIRPVTDNDSKTIERV